MSSSNDQPSGRSPAAVGLLLAFALVAGDLFVRSVDVGTVAALLFVGGVLAWVWGDGDQRRAGSAAAVAAVVVVAVHELLLAVGQRVLVLALLVVGIALVGWFS